MKKIIYIILSVFIPMFIQSCNMLDLEPEDYNGSGNYWKNESHVNSFMIGLHSDLRDALSQNSQFYGEFRGGTMRKGTNTIGTSTDVSGLVVNNISEDSPQRTNWGGFYGKILQVNHMIEMLENECSFLSEDSRSYYKGIAYGLRAYYYFWLYRSYGGVPIEIEVKVTGGSISTPDLYLERASAEETLQRIKDDVKISLDNFNNTTKTNNDFYYWSKDASLMLKAEVYLWSAKVTTDDYKEKHVATGKTDLEIAKNALLEIKGYELTDFNKLFTEAGKSKKENKETILALYFDKDEKTDRDWFRKYFYHTNFNGVEMVDKDGNALGDELNLLGEGLLYREYKKSLFDAYDDDDIRRSATFFDYYRKSDMAFGCSMKKYFGQTIGTTHYFDPDVVLYRYADAILMMAEIENGLTGKCASYINQIRERAYGDNFTEDKKYVDGTYAENELAILKERDKEFVAEGKRWFDLLRMHDADKNPLVFSAEAAYKEEDETTATPVLDKTTEAYKVLWPIERTLISNDPLLKQTINYPTIDNK